LLRREISTALTAASGQKPKTRRRLVCLLPPPTADIPTHALWAA
jgi:hypothetical protein